MSNCPNCKKQITCNCELRTLTTGLQVCAGCFQQLQTQINLELQKKAEENKQ